MLVISKKFYPNIPRLYPTICVHFLEQKTFQVNFINLMRNRSLSQEPRTQNVSHFYHLVKLKHIALLGVLVLYTAACYIHYTSSREDNEASHQHHQRHMQVAACLGYLSSIHVGTVKHPNPSTGEQLLFRVGCVNQKGRHCMQFMEA